MEQLKKMQAPTSTPPTIRVKLQTGANNSVEFNSSGVESVDACNTIEYLAQSSLKTSQELERLYFRNSALFIVCTTLILASLAFAIGMSATRYFSTITQSSPRYQQYEQN
jgi:hypothetical protein